MNDEDLNRKFDLVADQLATVTTNLQRVEEVQARDRTRLDRLERVVKMALRVGLRERRDTREKINALIDSQIRLEQAMLESRTQTNALIDSQIRLEQAMLESRTQMNVFQERTSAFEEKVGTALTEMAQAIKYTNQRIDTLGGNGQGKE